MTGIKLHLLAMERADPADVVRMALRPLSLTDFGGKHGFTVQEVSQALNGFRRHQKIRNALAAELEVSREEIDGLLDRAMAT